MSTKQFVFDQVLQDERGRVIGKARSYRRPLTKAEREWCEKFLRAATHRRENEEEKNSMSKRESQTSKTSPDKCNIVYIAGEIQKISVRDEDAFLLLDSGPEKKFVPCTVYKDERLIEILGRFSTGDQIKLVGFVRPWSQKKNDVWENNMDIRITEVKTEPPRRQQQTRSKRDDITDDDIPF